jgi:hypothetical protein
MQKLPEISVTDGAYERYLARKKYLRDEKLRPDGQTFAEAMCSGSTVEGLENGEEILGLIRKAGD